MNRFARVLLFAVVALSIFTLSLSGCLGGSSPVAVTLSASNKTIDQGQTVNVTASVANDSKSQGVTWTLSGPGSLTNQTASSVTYDAPASVTSNTTASITATSVTDPTKMTSVTITVAPAPSITTASVNGGTAGTAFSATISDSGGTGPYAWSITSGTLPAGLSLVASTSTSVSISGTPTGSGSFPITVKVTDADGLSSTQNLTITIAAPPPLTITTTSLANATIGIAYSQTLQANGGVKAYTWGLASGSLPSGLQLSSAGVISGTPSGTLTGTVSFTVKVTDSETPTAVITTQTLTIAVTAPPLNITTNSLPSATIGTAYTAQLAATGGIAPLTWSMTNAPSWLVLNPSTGALSGTPNGTFTGTLNVTLTVTDSTQPTAQSKSVTLNITVTVAPVTVTTTQVPTGVVGSSYSATLQASGGISPYTWAVSGLPAGLSVNTSTGVISGTPTASGTFALSVTVTDSETPTAATKTVSLNLVINPQVAVTTTSLPSGTIGSAYPQTTLQASGGISPYTWSVTSGSLPAGLQLSSAGVISGTPTGPLVGTTTFTVTVTDAENPAKSATASLSITVTATALQVTTTSLQTAVINNSYSATLAASGGVQPYTWALASGSLPTGVSLNASTGVISGTPTVTGNFSFTVTVTDSETPTAQTDTSGTLTLTVNNSAPLAITTTSLPTGLVSSSYSTTLQASGGVQPYTWAISSGSLPAGLTLNTSTGAISGTPSASGSSTFTVKVTDSTKPTAGSTTATLTITINAALSITTTSLPSGTVNVSYSASVQVTGGIQPYTWAVGSGSLPAGLSLNTSTGAISGTPTATGSPTFTITVTDSETPTAVTVSQSYTVTINATASCTNNANLSGNYAFLFQSWNGSGYFTAAGSFAADGNGNLTSGLVDTNNAGTGKSPQSGTFTGTYCIASNNVGSMTFNFASPLNGSATFAFGISSSGKGSFIEYGSSSNAPSSGILRKQDTTAFATSKFAGNYVLGMIGVDSAGARMGMVGVTNLTGSGEVDIDDAGTTTNTTLSSSNFSIGSNGRGTVTLTATGKGSLNFALYVVSATSLIAIETDNVSLGSTPLVSGQLLQQSGTLSLSGTSVIEFESLHSGGTPGVDAGFGTVSGSNQLTFDLDENKGGTMGTVSGTATFSIASNGRVTLTGPSNPPIIYLAQANHGFMIGTNTAVDFGDLDAQTGGPFSNSSLSGTYVGGSEQPVGPSVSSDVNVVTVTSPGNFSIIDDNVNGSGSSQATFPATYSVASTGKVTVTCHLDVNGNCAATGTASVVGYLYISSSAKIVMLPVGDSNPKLSVFYQK